MPRESEIGLNLAPFFREHQRQDEARAEMFRRPREGACSERGLVLRERAAAFAEQLLPALRMTVFHDGQTVEERSAIRIGLDGSKRAVKKGGIAFVAVVLVPRLVRLGNVVLRRGHSAILQAGFTRRTAPATIVRVSLGPYNCRASHAELFARQEHRCAIA